MKRVIVFIAACAVASCVATTPDAGGAAQQTPAHGKAAVPAKAASHEAARLAALRQLAPADEYFGQLKLSILGIKNTIKDLGLRYDVNHDIAKQTLASAAFTESAIRDWEHKYPRDREVPRAMYFLQRLYAHIVYDQSQLKAKATAAWLFADYPKSPQAKVLKKAIAEATPMPSASASAAPSEAQQVAPASADASAAPSSAGSAGAGSSPAGPAAQSSSAPAAVSSPAPKTP